MTDGKTCPACGKPTGGYVPCPHCGADPRIRVTIKFALVICAIVLVFGAVYFAMHLATMEPQPVAIASIDTWMDYSYVWLEGVVSYGPQYSETSISFDIYDGSGSTLDESSISVEIYDPAFKNLISENKVPRVGDNVKLFGQLRVYLDGGREFRVSSASDVQLTRGQPVETTIQELRASWGTEQSLMFKRVNLEGTITNVRPLSSAKIYTLEDNSSGYTIDLEMYVHNGLQTYIENELLNVNVLQRVRVSAGVSQYYGKAQLAISDHDEITLIENENWSPHESLSLDDVDSTMRDNFVKVSGEIIFVEMFGENDSLEVTERYLWLDNKYNPRIRINEGIYKLFGDNVRDLLRNGSQIELVGRVSRTDLQQVGGTKPLIDLIGPQELNPQSGTHELPPTDNFATITSDNWDDIENLVGTVINIENIPKDDLPSDRRLTIQHNFGENIQIFVPNTIYERVVNPPALGDNIQVIGKVTTSAVVQPGLADDLQKVS